MKLLFDYFPIICFFIAFKLWGIYVATLVTIVASALQVGIFWLVHKRFEKLHVITLLFVTILGGSTLLFHNDIFIKWKPTIVYWAFAVVFAGSHFIGSKTLIHHLFKNKISLPLKIWSRLNISWIFFFVVLGFLNLYVIYHFSTNAWVNFKLFGTLGLMILFIIAQALYMSRYLQNSHGTT